MQRDPRGPALRRLGVETWKRFCSFVLSSAFLLSRENGHRSFCMSNLHHYVRLNLCTGKWNFCPVTNATPGRLSLGKQPGLRSFVHASTHSWLFFASGGRLIRFCVSQDDCLCSLLTDRRVNNTTMSSVLPGYCTDTDVPYIFHSFW
jgi:hypothetical protein